MDVVDAVPRPRRQRPKDSFQNELQAKLHQRKSLGLVADITDSDEDGLGSLNSGYYVGHAGRPVSAKRRSDQSPDLSHGLGTRTMKSKDLTQMLRNSASISDDDDEEIVAANLGRASPGSSWQPGGRKSTSPSAQSKFVKKPTAKESLKDQTGKLDTLVGRKTPTKEFSSVSKEDIIFGRKTPSGDGKKSPKDGSTSKNLPGVDGDKWQPPHYRSVSPSSSTEHSRGSRGVTPIDSLLDTISESPGERKTPHIQRGERQRIVTSEDDKPKPQARGKVSDRKTPPLVEPRRTSPLSHKEPENRLKRASPTIDIFGRSRTAAAQDLDEFIGTDKDKKQEGRKAHDDHRIYGRSHTRAGSGSRDKTPEIQGSGKFIRDDRKTPTGRKSPTESQGRKSPADAKRSRLQERKPWETKSLEEEEREKALENKDKTLLDFLNEGSAPEKPKPQERGKRARGKENQDQTLDDIYGTLSTSRMRGRSADGHKSPKPSGRKIPEQLRKSPETVSQPGEMFKTIPKQQRAEDTSSMCEDIPPDPNRKVSREERREKHQRTERAHADDVINTISGAQTMSYIEPAKKMRPVTANAKVQHRPKPRYGLLPGEKSKSLTERQFNSTGDIRDAIYEEWYRERIQSAKRKKMEEQRRKEQEEEKKKKEEEEKRLEAEASYRAWKEKKKELLMTEQEKKDEVEKRKKEKEEQEKKEKKIESVKSFESWKKKKDVMIKRELHKKEDEKRRLESKKKEEEDKKRKERETAFRGWQNQKKDEEEKQREALKRDENEKRKKKEEEKYELMKKEEDAVKIYNKWVEEKERHAKLEKKKAKRQILDEDYKPAWSPASRTIPFGR